LFLKDLNCVRLITPIIVIGAGQTKMSLGRTFRLREQMSLQIRVEFFNIINRTEINNPTGYINLSSSTVRYRT
jgi:hypothetical protein